MQLTLKGLNVRTLVVAIKINCIRVFALELTLRFERERKRENVAFFLYALIEIRLSAIIKATYGMKESSFIDLAKAKDGFRTYKR